MDDGWSIVESPFRTEHAKAYEGLFTLGSGYLHVRGALEEHLDGAPQNETYWRLPANVTSEPMRHPKSKWGTYVPGVYGRHPLLNDQLINLPWFLGLTPVVEGERLNVETSDIVEYRRTLRLDTSTLIRTLRWRTRSGVDVVVTFERFVSATHPHVCLQRLSIKPARDAHVEIESGIDADVRTNGYDHFTRVHLEQVAPDAADCTVHTDLGDQVQLRSELKASGAAWQYAAQPRSATFHASFRLPSGSPLCIEKRTAVATSRDPQYAASAEHLAAVRSRSFEQVLEEHVQAWRGRWATCDVCVEGDVNSQRALRAALFHLLRAHPGDDARVAIDAKGYAGEAYWGRFFWDSEMYLLPFYLYTDPRRARTLADFRVNTLDGARANARHYGYPGARYAWESNAAGRECCPNWQYADHEVHVTADVAYGLAHYAKATDFEYLRDRRVAEVLVETARYWLARIDRRPSDDACHLLGVMGPDEYTPFSSDNAYTNRMVRFALEAAAEHGAAGGAALEECEQFRRVAGALPILRAGDGVLVLQCDEFERMAEPRFDELWRDRSKTFAAQVPQERLYRSKCLKQADVLMLMLLFPHEFSDEEVRRAWDYYLPYTTHDSSLSAGAHAIVAQRLGLYEEAWDFWQRGSRIDLNVEHGGAAEGIHIANAAAVWQMAVFGFAGMRTATQSEVLTLTPRLPDAWGRLAFPIVWKGCGAYVEITPNETKITNRGLSDLVVCVYEDLRTVGAGEQECWSWETQPGV